MSEVVTASDLKLRVTYAAFRGVCSTSIAAIRDEYIVVAGSLTGCAR